MSFVERFDGDHLEIDAPAPVRAPDDGHGVDAALIDVGGDERRMHVRAYNHWVAMLKGQSFPSITDLDPTSIADFGLHSVLLDFTGGLEDPRIAWLGRALREECGLEAGVERVADVPSRSLLSRLTDHYLQIIANRAPIGFEAEFIGTRGRTTLYRGILMPFSSDGERIDFIYGVINWKEVADALTQASIDSALAAVLRGPRPARVPAVPVWADGPSADLPAPSGDGADPLDLAAPLAGSLADRLELARESAAAARAADTRSRAALYRALGRAHDFALAAEGDEAGYEALLAAAGIAVQPRAPMTPIVKLVFGADYDKTRLAEYAAVLAHGRQRGVAPGGLPRLLEATDGGIKALVAAERAGRRAAAGKTAAGDRAMVALRDAAPIATIAVEPEGDGEFVVLVARRRGDRGLDVVASIASGAVVEAAVRRAAA